MHQLEILAGCLSADNAGFGQKSVDLRSSFCFRNSFLRQKILCDSGQFTDIRGDPDMVRQADIHMNLFAFDISASVPGQEQACELHGIVILHFQVDDSNGTGPAGSGREETGAAHQAVLLFLRQCVRMLR